MLAPCSTGADHLQDWSGVPVTPTQEPIGQYYTLLHQDALHAAEATAAALPTIHEELRSWQALMFDNSLPEWLQDFLLNSVSYIHKTSLFFRDGRFRHHESFSCTDIEPNHVEFFGSLPYAFWLPQLQQSTHAMRQRYQLHNTSDPNDGSIAESYSGGCAFAATGIDTPIGREMGDVSSTFLLETFKQHHWVRTPYNRSV